MGKLTRNKMRIHARWVGLSRNFLHTKSLNPETTDIELFPERPFALSLGDELFIMHDMTEVM